MFSRLYLEITTCCNRACSFCPGTARPAAFVTPETFRALAAKLRPYGQYLYLHVMGEPLLHPQLPELLEICRAGPAQGLGEPAQLRGKRGGGLPGVPDGLHGLCPRGDGGGRIDGLPSLESGRRADEGPA